MNCKDVMPVKNLLVCRMQPVLSGLSHCILPNDSTPLVSWSKWNDVF